MKTIHLESILKIKIAIYCYSIFRNMEPQKSYAFIHSFISQRKALQRTLKTCESEELCAKMSAYMKNTIDVNRLMEESAERMRLLDETATLRSKLSHVRGKSGASGEGSHESIIIFVIQKNVSLHFSRKSECNRLT